MKLAIRSLLALLFFGGLQLAHAQLEKRDVHIAVGGKVALYYLPLTITLVADCATAPCPVKLP